ncbi:unnamed protein product [Ceutorhynchus assimilis]|uniref:B box-type domain-containing protein n=1 Tax=Ceutorhynchus assimilis TaxID=467358 RepID=A0A9N9QM29_9CUCU|nr:unnamed protein product [Ceutorhynchus assimilis]
MNQPDLVKCGDHDLENSLYCLQCFTDLCLECYRTHRKDHEVQALDVALLKIRYRHEPLLEELKVVDEEVNWELVYKLPGGIPINEQFVAEILEFHQECVLHPYTVQRWYLACGSCLRKVCYQCFYINGFSLKSAYDSLVYHHRMVRNWGVEGSDDGYFSGC